MNYVGHESKLILKRKVVNGPIPSKRSYDGIKEVSSIVRMRILIGCSDKILIKKW